ncbi:MAG: LrgB family protein [Campylobacter sp.]
MFEILSNSAYFGLVISLFSYQIALIIKNRLKFVLFNPLLVSVALCIGILLTCDVSYEKFMASSEMIGYLLIPATASLAVPLYEQIELLKSNWVAILSGIVSGILAGLTTIFILALLFGLNHELYVTLLSKSVTTPIGIAISSQLGGIVTISVSVIIITGVSGAMLGEYIFKWLKIDAPIAQGVALGTASHAMGTAKAIELGDIQAAMASLSIAVTGILTFLGAWIFSLFI